MDLNLTIGQQFSDVKAFRKAIKEAAIAQHFELKILKSDLIRYSAKCSKEECPWRIRAVKVPSASTFVIKSIEGTHTCGKDAQLGHHHQASVDWIVNLIEQQLRNNVNYKPKDILEDIQKKYGIIVPYKQAWRAKERVLTAIYGSSEEGYCLLPVYCEQIKLSNAGSIAHVSTTGSDHRFHRLFVSFSGSIHGFLNGCLPIVCFGGINLKSKYLGTLFSATSFDADGGLFPIAFGVVDIETDESWMWFLSEFHKLLEVGADSLPQLTILSDGQRGIVEASRRKFPTAYQGLCMHHLIESINKEFKNSRLVHLLWRAAYSITATGFKERMAELDELCAEAGKRILQFPPNRWAVVFIQGSRFGHLSSNTEAFNSWIVEACELPILQVIERIHSKLMEVFNERKKKASEWTSVLVPSAEERIMNVLDSSMGYQVLRSDEVEFEILSSERSDIVNIGTRTCSCRDWQLYGIPCSHAVAALLSSKKSVYDYTEKYFTVAKYRETYSQPVCPIPDKREWSTTSINTLEEEQQIVRPPKFRRPPGRPEKKRASTEEAKREKHTVHCSRCSQSGHYKRTCKAEISPNTS